MKLLNPKIRQKFAESLKAVLPVVGIVIVLSFTIAPITSSILLCFLVVAKSLVGGTLPKYVGVQPYVVEEKQLRRAWRDIFHETMPERLR